MLSRLALAPPIISSTFVRSNVRQFAPRSRIIIRQFQNDSRQTINKTRAERIAERQTGTGQTLKEKILAPAGPNGNKKNEDFFNFQKNLLLFLVIIAFALGKGALAGGSALALGALCFYGIGLGKDANIAHHSL